MSPTCISRIISGHAHAIMHARPSTLLLLLGTRIISETLNTLNSSLLLASTISRLFPGYFSATHEFSLVFLGYFPRLPTQYLGCSRLSCFFPGFFLPRKQNLDFVTRIVQYFRPGFSRLFSFRFKFHITNPCSL